MKTLRKCALTLLLAAMLPAVAIATPQSDDAPAEAAVAPAGGATLGLVTGAKTGTYIQVGRDIAAAAQKDGLTVNVYDSNGSIDNIKRITSKEKVGLAIVQSDVLGFLSRSHNAGSLNTSRKLRLVETLYNEEV